MGFRTGAFAKVWEVTPQSDTNTTLKVSISRKDKTSGEYDTEFHGFVSCLGTAAAKRAACLKEGDRIKLGTVDVTNKYDKDKNKTYVNYKVFSFETEAEASSNKTESKDAADGGSNEPESPAEKAEEGKELPF